MAVENMNKVMIIDDDEKAVFEIASMLEGQGYTVAAFTSGIHAMKTLEAVQGIDLILTDIRMPGVDGMEILEAAQKQRRPVPVIVLTGYGDIDTAVAVMRAGASDFLCKPVSTKELVIRIKKVLEKASLADEVASLRKKLEGLTSFHSIVGGSKKMLEVYELVGAVASTDATVLVRGETGTGKELVARAIHNSSGRKDAPFVAISCTSMQATLLESELFGHEKGSFTGAHSAKTGKFESAASGTVFLDEVGDMPPEIQVKLLRVLQEREFERVGGLKSIKLNARVIAATNRDLEQMVREGRFREDLYYRLNVMQIDLPPLRERSEDIMALATHFLEHFNKHHEKSIEGFAPSAIEQLLEHHWPGNVRELKNAVERTVLTNPRRWVERISRLDAARKQDSLFGDFPVKLPYLKAKEAVEQELEKTYLVQYMKQERGHINKVAELMGVSIRTVSRQLEKYGLNKSLFRDRQREHIRGELSI